MNRAEVERACERIERRLRSDPRYAHTRSFLLTRDGQVVWEAALGDGRPADVFSVTKTVLALVLGAAIRDGAFPADLYTPLGALLPAARGTPAERHTVRDLLTMRRGAETGGAWDIDAVMALPGGWVEQIARAPQLEPPGTAFRYDNGGAHLLGAALERAVGDLPAFARDRLFAPLEIAGAQWQRDPDGVTIAFGHLALAPRDLERLGRLLLDNADAYAGAMLTPWSGGGPPEALAYGYLTWLGDRYRMAGGWAGNHVLAVPRSRSVVVVTGDSGFDPGPPPSDRLPRDWRPALDLVRGELLPLLLA